MLLAYTGRAAELARIGRLLDEAAGQPAALLIEGEAGIGKLTLWSAGSIRPAIVAGRCSPV